MSSPVSVVELQRAWAAVSAGEFRSRESGNRRRHSADTWSPTEPVVVVAGATGRVGASTIALAIATASERRVRLIECASMRATGLAAATTAELGVTNTGWRRGNRDQILIERTTTGTYQRPDDLPAPDEADCDLTIVDASWDLATIGLGDSWLTTAIETAPLVVVTVATVPGLRMLDNALHMIGHPADTWSVVIGPKYKKWPPPLRLATTHTIEEAIASGRLITVPTTPSLALKGLTPDPLPAGLVNACRPILDQAVGLPKGHHHDV